MKGVLSVLLLLVCFTLPKAALAGDRIWTDIDGRELTARVVAKDEKSILLRLVSGKRVPVPLNRLSLPDKEWLKSWKAADFSVKTRLVNFKGLFGLDTAREFTFEGKGRDGRGRLYPFGVKIFEDEIPAYIKATNEFFALIKKKASLDLKDVEYEKALYKGKKFGQSQLTNLLAFQVKDGEIKPTGSTMTRGYAASNGGATIEVERLQDLLDFLEGFSVKDWDKRQEKIKRQFE